MIHVLFFCVGVSDYIDEPSSRTQLITLQTILACIVGYHI